MKKSTKLLSIPANRILILLMMDIMAILVASFGSLFLRFEFDFDAIMEPCLENYIHIIPFTVIVSLLFFWIFKLYKSVWRYASATEMVNIGLATTSAAVVQTIFCYATGNLMPRSYYVLYWFFLFMMICAIRFSYRFLRIFKLKRSDMVSGTPRTNVMVIGAGAAGNAILKEIESSQFIHQKVKCIIDDGPGCHGKIMRGVPIVGGRDKIAEAVRIYGIDEIIFAIPSASTKERKEILEICKPAVSYVPCREFTSSLTARCPLQS